MVNIPKTRKTYCRGGDCKKHTLHKVTQYSTFAPLPSTWTDEI